MASVRFARSNRAGNPMMPVFSFTAIRNPTLESTLKAYESRLTSQAVLLFVVGVVFLSRVPLLGLGFGTQPVRCVDAFLLREHRALRRTWAHRSGGHQPNAGYEFCEAQ